MTYTAAAGCAAGGAAVNAAAEAHRAVLPAALGQPARAGGAAAVPARPAAQARLHRLPEGRPGHTPLAGAAAGAHRDSWFSSFYMR